MMGFANEDKRKEIKKITLLLMQMDETGINLLTRDANTLLTYQRMLKEKSKLENDSHHQ